MPIAITADDIRRYVLNEERDTKGKPKPDATIFLLRPLTEAEKTRIRDRHVKLVAGQPEFSEFGTFIGTNLRLGLAGWENFKDAKGREVPFKQVGRNATENANLSYLSDAHKMELAFAIFNDSEVTEEDLGNSPSPSA